MYIFKEIFIGRIGCKFNRRIVVVTCLIIVIIILFTFKNNGSYYIMEHHDKSFLPYPYTREYYYGIIDAGSTGSRLYMYKVKGGNKHNLEYLRFPDGNIVSYKITPGLSDFVDNPSDAVNYMLDLFVWLENNVNSDIVKQTSISILATAGMRLLSVDKQKQIVTILKEKLPDKVKCKIVQIKIISGVMEGVYQWVANNYLRGLLDTSYNCRKFTSRIASYKNTTLTSGIVEVGGASLQIVYEKFSDSFFNKVFTYWNPTIRKRIKYKLHSESLLGYGMQSMFHWYLSPENIYSSSYEKSACILKNGVKNIYIDSNTTIYVNNTSTITIVGNGNFLLCLKSLENALINSGKLIKDNNGQLNLPKTIDDYSNTLKKNILDLNISPRMELDGFAEIFYGSYEFYHFDRPFTMENIKYYTDKAIEYCNTNFTIILTKLNKGYFNTKNEDNILCQCFKSAYILLLNRIICSNGCIITPRFKYGNKEVQWTYGALIEYISHNIKSI